MIALAVAMLKVTVFAFGIAVAICAATVLLIKVIDVLERWGKL